MLKMLKFIKETISAKFLWGNVLFAEKLQIGAKNSNFTIFESARYTKSVSMPLSCVESPVIDLLFFFLLVANFTL